MCMDLYNVQKLLQAKVLTGSELMHRKIESCCGSDMMSDVLAHVDDQTVLITGLCNPQVLRTAEMMDIVCVIMVRGKKPDPAMIEMAIDRNICLLTTPLPMFTSCGLLFEAGLRGGDQVGK